jgi:hypothetical protein
MRSQNAQPLSILEARSSQRLCDALAGQDPLYFLGAGQTFAPFLALFQPIDLQAALEDGRKDGGLSQMKDGSIYLAGLPEMVRLHAEKRTSHVLFSSLNENWGAFSTPVPHRTADWGIWQDHLFHAGCTPEMVRAYLDDPAVKAVVTPHHTVFWHPTILSLPVGISTTCMTRLGQRHRGIQQRVGLGRGKTQDLLLNNSGWAHRQQVNERVIANFDGRLANTFGLKPTQFYAAVTRSRFVLCPSGLGWDTSRLWETLLLGSIPIVEYSEGWHTVLDDLPVLFVTNFDEVTPALLAQVYPQILSRCEQFNYGKLTNQWWQARISALLAGPRTQN